MSLLATRRMRQPEAPPRGTDTVVRAPPATDQLELIEDLGLFLACLPRGPATLEGLSPELARRIRLRMDAHARCTAEQRRARLAQHFGVQLGAEERVRDLFREAPEGLRAALWRVCPRHLRPREFETSGPTPASALSVFAVRLLQEATR